MTSELEKKVELVQRLKIAIEKITPAILSSKCSAKTVTELITLILHVAEHGTLPASPEPPAAKPATPSRPPTPASRVGKIIDDPRR